MTSETRIYVEPTDIVGVEIVCPHRKSRLSYHLKLMQANPPDRCYNCNKPFFEAIQGERDVRYDQSDLIELLKAAKTVACFASTHRLKVRLEVTPSVAQKSEQVP